MNLELLEMSRAFRRTLRLSSLPEYRRASIRDAVELAADNMRQWAHEKQEEKET